MPPEETLGTPVATLFGFEPGAVAMPALPGIAPADPLTPGSVIVLCPGVRPRGTVGVTGVVAVPPGAPKEGGWAAIPTGGVAISPWLEAALMPPTSALNSGSTIKSLRKVCFITGGFLSITY